jgi:SAM-dependent methyltransferase
MTQDLPRTHESNARFWTELCGTALAQSIGLTGDEPDACERFDAAYFAYYPYLAAYLDRTVSPGDRVLEIGLGYGTVGEYLAKRTGGYVGLDVSAGPVEMLRARLRSLALPEERAVEGSALELPFEDASFDSVVSIGCLHHTGDLDRSVAEVARVLRPGGRLLLMLYNRRSGRMIWRHDIPRLLARIGRAAAFGVRSSVLTRYDANAAGDAAPHTDFVTRSDVRRLLAGFEKVEIRAENLLGLHVAWRLSIPRERLLGSPFARGLGLDLYISATKSNGPATVRPAPTPQLEAGS